MTKMEHLIGRDVIVKKLPTNSHFEFDFLASFAGDPKSRDPEWYDTSYNFV